MIPIEARAGAFRRRGRRRLGLAGLALVAAAAGLGAWLAFGRARWPSLATLQGPGPSVPLAFAPDGATLATRGPGGITLWDVAKGRPRADWRVLDGQLDGRTIEVVEAAFTPTGQELIVLYREVGKGPAIRVDRVDEASGVVRGTVEAGLGWAGPDLFAFDGDGRALRLILRGASGGLVGVDCDLANSEVLASRPLAVPPSALAAGGGLPTALAISNDARLLAFALPGSAVGVWGIDQDREVVRLPGSGLAEARSAAFSGDRETLAVGRLDGSIELWGVARGTLQAAWRGHAAGMVPTLLRFAPDDSSLLSVGERGILDGIPGSPPPWVPAWLRGSPGPAASRSETIAFELPGGAILGRAADEGWPAIGPHGDILATGSPGSGPIVLRKLPGRPERPAALGPRSNPW